MKSKILAGVLSFFLLVIAAACSNDDDKVSPNKNASLTLKASSPVLKADNGPDFTEAYIHVEEVEFEALEVGDDDVEVDFEGPFKIDLLTGKSNPEIPTSYLVPAKYEEVELELDDDVSPNLIVKGTVMTDGATELPFEFFCDEDFDFEAEAEDTENDYLFEVVEGLDVAIVMEFDLQAWFQGVDIALGEQQEGVVLISKTVNKALYDQVKNNIENTKLVVYDAN